MATKTDFSETLRAFLARKLPRSDAQAQVDETTAALNALRARLTAALHEADKASVAASEGLEGASKERDSLRATVRELRDQIGDAELLLTARTDRLTDAKAVEHQKAIAATWTEAKTHFARREQAAAECAAAVAALATALEAVNTETALLHVLLRGKQGEALNLLPFRGTLGVMLLEATGGRPSHITVKPLVELVSDQHDLVLSETKL